MQTSNCGQREIPGKKWDKGQLSHVIYDLAGSVVQWLGGGAIAEIKLNC